MQSRMGPMRVGPSGLLQPIADVLKLVSKEIIIPTNANKGIFLTAPMLMLIPSLLVWSVIPLSEYFIISNINAGLLFILALTSLSVYGVILAGWASNSKYAFLGSMRSAAQIIAYEIAMGFALVGVLMLSGSLNLQNIIYAQSGSLFNWYWLPHFPMVILFFVSALAETNRPPFDLPEAESELVAGYQVEYSSTPFLLFMAGELIAVFLMCALTSLLFFGGWLSPIPALPDGVFWMILKMGLFFFIFAMIKAITPRYRYDQLMRLGWKVFLPFSLVWVVFVAFLAKFEVFGGFYARYLVGG